MTRPNWFVALPVPADGWYALLPAPPPQLRLLHPDDLHLTVAFLGAVEEAKARAAFELANELALGPTEVALGSVEPMGNKRRPSALSVTLRSGREAVARAIEGVRDAMCMRAGAKADARPALPHITIARPMRNASPDQRRAAVAWARAVELGDARVTLRRVALFTWSAERRDRKFEERASIALRPRPLEPREGPGDAPG
jgi:2'-5' RNA ligase